MAPKTYFAIDRTKMDIKRSSKGVQHRVKLTYDDYKATLYENKTKEVTNTSIRVFRENMRTVECQKAGLRNLFYKAFTDSDKITVSPFKKFQ